MGMAAIFKFVARCLVIVLMMGAGSYGGNGGSGQAAHAASDSKGAIVQAQKHFRTDNLARFARYAEKVAPIYQPLMEYWLAVLHLRQKKETPILNVMANSESPYFRYRARRYVLQHHIDRKEWRAVAAHAAAGEDCEGVLRAVAGSGSSGNLSDKDRAAFRTLWSNDRKISDNICIALYRLGKARGLLTDDDIWMKIRVLAGNNQLSATKRLLYNFPRYVRYRTVRSVVRKAVRYIKGKHGLNSRQNRELVMISAIAAARKSPKTAIKRWRAFSRYFTKADNEFMWTMLGEWAARWHRDDALVLLRRGKPIYENDLTRAWRVRAGLRLGDFEDVLATINRMPPEEQSVTAWQYWRIIAQQQEHGGDNETAAAMKTLAQHSDFYGLLARETLGLPLVKTAPPPAPSTLPEPEGDLALALALYESGLKELAKTIWRFARKQAVSDEQRIVAARRAAALGWNLAAINVASGSASPSVHTLQYPTPFSEPIDKYAQRFGLDPAFVYGLIRQESRFMPNIVSHANARGLMQVIPRTARNVARRHKYTRYRLSRLKRVDTNVIIGTTYMSELNQQFRGHPAKIAAGYNAGPTRIKRWFRASDDILITIENIPITETRLYVKHLLANRAHYQAVLGAPPTQFAALLESPLR